LSISGDTSFIPEAIGDIKITAETSRKQGVIARWTEGADPNEWPRRIISFAFILRISLMKKPTSSISEYISFSVGLP
jgi:hypothetical protein